MQFSVFTDTGAIAMIGPCDRGTLSNMLCNSLTPGDVALFLITWWRHQMETFFALLAICAGNPPVTGEFLSQRPVTRSFDVFFDLRLNKRLSKQSRGWWFETPSRSLWYHCNVRCFSPCHIILSLHGNAPWITGLLWEGSSTKESVMWSFGVVFVASLNNCWKSSWCAGDFSCNVTSPGDRSHCMTSVFVVIICHFPSLSPVHHLIWNCVTSQEVRVPVSSSQ